MCPFILVLPHGGFGCRQQSSCVIRESAALSLAEVRKAAAVAAASIEARSIASAWSASAACPRKPEPDRQPRDGARKSTGDGAAGPLSVPDDRTPALTAVQMI